MWALIELFGVSG